jgi:CRP/FNR family transcriptional regulator
MVSSTLRPRHRASRGVECQHCNLCDLCLPAGLMPEELRRVGGRLVAGRRKVGEDEVLFHAGDRFDAIYAVWTGFFKTVLRSSAGRRQVTGFQMAGELLGLDAIDTGSYGVDAVALEDSEVCVIPYHRLATLAGRLAPLQAQFHRLMSRQIASDQAAMLQLGSMCAEERVAAFLLDLLHRLEARGGSATAMRLRMSREEIGSFLGLKLETVSRTLSSFHARGLLVVRQRDITVLAPDGLRQLLERAAA